MPPSQLGSVTFLLSRAYSEAAQDSMWLSKCLLLLFWVLGRDDSCEDLNINCSGEQRKGWKPKGLSDRDLSCLGKVVYSLKITLLLVYSDHSGENPQLESRVQCTGLCSACLLCCFEVGEGWLLDKGRPKDESAREVTNASICLNLLWTTHTGIKFPGEQVHGLKGGFREAIFGYYCGCCYCWYASVCIITMVTTVFSG